MFKVGQLVTIAPHILKDTTFHRDLPPQLANIPLIVTEVVNGGGYLQVSFLNPSSAKVRALPPTYISGWLTTFYTPFTPTIYRRIPCQ